MAIAVDCRWIAAVDDKQWQMRTLVRTVIHGNGKNQGAGRVNADCHGVRIVRQGWTLESFKFCQRGCSDQRWPAVKKYQPDQT
jgi:hypothetical protein